MPHAPTQDSRGAPILNAARGVEAVDDCLHRITDLELRKDDVTRIIRRKSLVCRADQGFNASTSKKGARRRRGKTEAPAPGQVVGVSPSVSASLARKERERLRNGSSHGGIENIGVFVSRSFQKERSDKKLLEATRTSLHLPSGFAQKSLRGASRRGESFSTDSTPRTSELHTKREERDKRFADAASHRTTSSGYKGTCKGKDEVVISRSSSREVGDERYPYRRSGKAPGEKSERRLVRRDERNAEYSRYNNVRDLKSVDSGPLKPYVNGTMSQRTEKTDELNTHRTSSSSPSVPKKSPRRADLVSSPTINLPVKSSCKCGVFRSPDFVATSTFQQAHDKVGVTGVGKPSGASPVMLSTNADVLRIEGRERRSREPSEYGAATPTSIYSHQFKQNTNSGSHSETPSVLHGRLALLEGRVSQIAAELKATKDLLDANNPVCSRAVLTDIQSKILGIEKAINYRLAKECGLVDQLEAQDRKAHFIVANQEPGRLEPNKVLGRSGHSVGNQLIVHGQSLYGKVSKHIHTGRALAVTNTHPSEGAGMSAAEKLSHLASLAAPRGKEVSLYQCLEQGFSVEVGGSAPSSHVKPAFDHNEFEERLYPHQKLLKNRPGVQQKLIENRAALHQKLLENSVLLRDKLAALEERDGLHYPGLEELGATNFINSLKQSVASERMCDFENCAPRQGSFTSHCEAGESNCHPSVDEHEDMALQREKLPKGEISHRGRLSAPRKNMRNSPARNVEPFYQGSRGASDRRRRSSEKRKSISNSDSGSPEIDTGVSQIVMLEPTRRAGGNSIVKINRSQGLPSQSCLSAGSDGGMRLTCSEPRVPDLNLIDEGQTAAEEWMSEGQQNFPTNSSSSPLSLPGEEEAVRTSLGCDESLTSEDVCDEQLQTQQADDDEQPYLGECEDNVPAEKTHQVGDKIATAGWFLGEGEGALLAHDDGSCSLYDVLNLEGKANYRSPANLNPGTWRDCWLIRAAGPDGTSNKYIVASSAGSKSSAAFCSWDFYDRRLTALNCSSFQSSFSNLLNGENPDSVWWYRPCSPLLAATGTCTRSVFLYDIRDADTVMKWDLNGTVAPLEVCSPIQWRSKGRLVVAEESGLSLWDVNGMSPNPVVHVGLNGKTVRAMHVRSSDAETSAGIRQRLSSRDGQTGDGVCLTEDAVNVLDFRVPAGIVLKITTFTKYSSSVAVNGDLIFVGVTDPNCGVGLRSHQEETQPKILQWSVKLGKPMSMYKLPPTSGSRAFVSQVWGTADYVMGMNRSGLFMFDALKQDSMAGIGGPPVSAFVGTNDFLDPEFDFAGNRILLISRDRPALWRHWP